MDIALAYISRDLTSSEQSIEVSDVKADVHHVDITRERGMVKARRAFLAFGAIDAAAKAIDFKPKR